MTFFRFLYYLISDDIAVFLLVLSNISVVSYNFVLYIYIYIYIYLQKITAEFIVSIDALKISIL